MRVRTEKQTAVLPAMPLPPDWRPGAVPTDEDPEYSKVKPGDDPSEIFDFHSYREGDPIARIHWKLSSKHDELMVKEFSLPLPGKVLCLPDYRLCGGFPESAQRLDAMLSLLRAVALMLTESGSQTPGMLCSLHDTEPTDVQSEADLNDWLCALLSVTPARASKKSDPVQDIVQPVADRLRNTRNADRLLVFLPAADPALLAALAALEAPERLTIFTVFCSGEEEAQLRAVDCPFELVTVSAEAQPPAEQAQPETAQPKKRGGAVLP